MRRSDHHRKLQSESHHTQHNARKGRQQNTGCRRQIIDDTSDASGDERGKARPRRKLRREGIIIRTWDLMKTYVMGDQTIHAVSGVDIEIKKGEYVAIMGPSGSGSRP